MLPLLLVAPVLLIAASVPPPTGPVAAARSWPSGAHAWEAPVDPPILVAPFDPPAQRWLPGHRGVDLAAAWGDEVRAAGPGTVTWAGPLAGRGVVVVAHADGLRTTYEPVDPDVAVGDVVEAGDVLGTVADGEVHCGHPPRCVHWGLRRGDAYLDPWQLLDPGRAVLLPP